MNWYKSMFLCKMCRNCAKPEEEQDDECLCEMDLNELVVL